MLWEPHRLIVSTRLAELGSTSALVSCGAFQTLPGAEKEVPKVRV
jgi:hypothetical protein